MGVNKSYNPPRWAHKLFEWFCCRAHFEIIEGDLYELFQERVTRLGKTKAQFLYIFDVFGLMRPFLLKRDGNYFFSTFSVMQNYFKISYRNFFRQKVYSSINVAGLAVGLACFILIFLYIRDELSYDKFHSKSNRIYRLIEHFQSDGIGEHSASQPFPVAHTLLNDYSGQVEQVVRLFNFQSPSLSLANTDKEREFNESRIFLADSTFFKVFDFKFIEGNKESALYEPNSILLTESMARKYFGDEEPMGQILQFQGTRNLIVTGVLEDSPLNAHFQFDFLISFTTINGFIDHHHNKNWYWNPCWTYVLLNENNDKDLLTSYLPEFVNKYFPEFIREDVTLELQPLADIHLKSKLDYEIQANSNESNIYVFSAVAIFVLLIAIINFVNLSTARATKRAKEVGVRKSLGSDRTQLVNQFIFESIFLTSLAVTIALIVVFFVIPYFNYITEKAISFDTLVQQKYIIFLLSLTLFVGLVSGLYPAFVLSSFKAVSALKSRHIKTDGLSFRKALVVLQFSISMTLIIGTIVALDQLKLLQNDEVGFEREHVVMVPIIRTPMAEHFTTYRHEALQHSSILSITAVEEIVGAKHQVGNYKFDGMDKSRPFPRLMTHYNFTKTFDIEMAAGRPYSESYSTDDSLALLVNETLVKQMGWKSNEEALNKHFGFGHEKQPKGKIVGVVKDFNIVSKHHPITPLILDLRTNGHAFDLFIKYMAVRVKGNDIANSLTVLEDTWKKFMPERPFDYFFLDNKLDDLYKSERKLSDVAGVFSFLTILVACLGLFGLATFATEQRKKEIGIRKVLGISNGQIMTLLSKDFLSLIMMAFVIACPLAYFLLRSWLDGFAYRVDISVWPFLVAGLITIAIALLTISFHSIKAALVNPVVALKYE
ncbi:MAG: ABC transporter permease [Cyclobacteriaceae bacterium]